MRMKTRNGKRIGERKKEGRQAGGKGEDEFRGRMKKGGEIRSVKEGKKKGRKK